ncbi:MAG: hypothetical protein IPL61_38330 [Myxococcales bacterium]|nr:hypothetical protein [Myxococcales bacterium]
MLGDHLLLWTRVLFHSWHRVRDGTMTRREFREHAGRLRKVIELLLEQGTTTYPLHEPHPSRLTPAVAA